MRYLLAASTYQRLYYFKLSHLFYTNSIIFKTLSKKFLKNRLFGLVFTLNYYSLNFKTYFPRSRKFRRICWFNSKSRWVFRSLNFGRGYTKFLLNKNLLPNFKPNPW